MDKGIGMGRRRALSFDKNSTSGLSAKPAQRYMGDTEVRSDDVVRREVFNIGVHVAQEIKPRFCVAAAMGDVNQQVFRESLFDDFDAKHLERAIGIAQTIQLAYGYLGDLYFRQGL